eukprot:Skav209201  [mRNA]  locus=scaffold2666:39718:40104:- [translate_table: standard]
MRVVVAMLMLATCWAMRDRSEARSSDALDESTEMLNKIEKPTGHPREATQRGFGERGLSKLKSIIEEEFSEDMLHWKVGIQERVEKQWPEDQWTVVGATMPAYMNVRHTHAVFTWGKYKFYVMEYKKR